MSTQINDTPVGRIGLGLMNFTWGQTVPREEAIRAIKSVGPSWHWAWCAHSQDRRGRRCHLSQLCRVLRAA